MVEDRVGDTAILLCWLKGRSAGFVARRLSVALLGVIDQTNGSFIFIRGVDRTPDVFQLLLIDGDIESEARASGELDEGYDLFEETITEPLHLRGGEDILRLGAWPAGFGLARAALSFLVVAENSRLKA